MKDNKITVCVTDSKDGQVLNQYDKDVPDIFNVFDVCDLCDENSCDNCIVAMLQMDQYTL